MHECALIGGIAPHLRRFPRRSRDGGCGGRACVPIVFAVFVPLRLDCTCGIRLAHGRGSPMSDVCACVLCNQRY